MSCTELGTWGPCNGGFHADNVDFCFSANADGCHAINAVPFEVTCPLGVDPCPLPTGTDYTALQSGEYTVTYTKVDNGVESECPRLDLDNISCDATETDPLNGGAFGFCAPENINMDYPPTDQWVRIGVHQFSHFEPTTILPNVKIFCNGALTADLGTLGFNAPFDWTSAEAGNDEIWLVADVLFIADQCSTTQCLVQPLYADAALQTPLVVQVDGSGNAPNGPAYPPIPP